MQWLQWEQTQRLPSPGLKACFAIRQETLAEPTAAPGNAPIPAVRTRQCGVGQDLLTTVEDEGTDDDSGNQNADEESPRARVAFGYS
jgi:hypothetical protein